MSVSSSTGDNKDHIDLDHYLVDYQESNDFNILDNEREDHDIKSLKIHGYSISDLSRSITIKSEKTSSSSSHPPLPPAPLPPPPSPSCHSPTTTTTTIITTKIEPTQPVTSKLLLLSSAPKQQGHQPKTLFDNDKCQNKRWQLLPKFPPDHVEESLEQTSTCHLLFSNVPC